MADDHHVRIILESIIRGSGNLRRFFKDTEKDVERFRKSFRQTSAEIDKIFTSSGVRGRDPRTKQFTSLKKDAEEATNSVRLFLTNLRKGLNEEKRIREEANRRFNLSDEERRKKIDKIDKEIASSKLKRINNLEKTEVGTIRQLISAERGRAESNIRALESEGRIIQNQINLREKLLSEKQLLNKEERKTAADSLRELREEREGIEQIIRARRVERDSYVDSEKRKIAALHARIREEENTRRSTLRRAVLRPSRVALEEDVRKEFRELEKDIDRVDSRLKKFGIGAGRNLGQFTNGLRLSRDGLDDNEKSLLKTASAATRFGANLGNAIRPAGAFRVRVLLLIGVLQIFLTLLIQLGAALIAVASSAIQAAAALGGALLAGITQLIPVVGLLAAAFNRLGKVIDAANLADKVSQTAAQDQKTKLEAIRQATQRLADSRYSLIQAAEAVQDSEFNLAQAIDDVQEAIKNQKESIRELADARKQAAQDIVDANFEEREAALALQEAELGILDAKRRLREEEEKSQFGKINIEDAKAQVKEAQARLIQARTEGDETEITLALQQLNVAEQDLQQIKSNVGDAQSNIKQAQIDVKQAQLQQEQAVVRNARAQENAAKARQQGVEGSDRVIRAQENLVEATKSIAQAERQQVLATRALRDSVHSLAIAKREEKDAEIGLTDARSKATAQQEQLQEALGDLSPAEKKLLASIQRIKRIYEKNFRPITDIIIGAFARAVDSVAVLLSDPKILSAAKTLAFSLSSSIDALSQFAISPEFKEFLVFSIQQAADNIPKITDGFIDLSRVLIRVAKAATPLFNELIDRFVNFLDRLEKRTKDTSGLEKFFGVAGRHLDSWINFAVAVGKILGAVIKFSAPAGKGILDDITEKLNEWTDWLNTNGEEVEEFFDRIRTQVRALAQVLGRIGIILFEAFSSEGAAELTTFILNTVIPAFTLFLEILNLIATLINKVIEIPVIGPLTARILQFGLALLFASKLVGTLIGPVGRLVAAFRALFTILRSGIIIATLSKALTGLVVAIKLVGTALRFIFITNPWIAIIVGIIAAVVLLDRKFHFLRPTLEFLLKIFQKVFNWIKNHWKLLLVILLGPFGLVLIGIIKWRDKILEIIRKIVDFIRDHWKLIIAILLAPFAIGGAIILAIIRWRERIFEIIKAMPGKIAEFFKNLPNLLKKIFDKIPGLLKDALSGLKDIVTGALSEIPIVGRFFGNAKLNEQDKIKIQNQVLADPKLDPQRKKIKALRKEGLKPDAILQALIEGGDLSEQELRKLIEKYAKKSFAHGGTVPGGVGQAVPVIAHAGEWVLNKAQQSRIAQALGISIEQAKNIIFGTGMNEQQKKEATKLRDAPGAQGFSGTTGVFGNRMSFNLVPKTDPDGIVVWFIEMADGAFGQVSPRDARKIIASKGNYIPGYVRRSTHGFRQNVIPFGIERGGKALRGGIVQGFAKGGIVQKWAGPALQSFAEGGTVLQQSSFGAPSVSNTKNIEQNFNVTTQGETDWNYVLRIGAIHAQASYS